jgi:hypothetical protein
MLETVLVLVALVVFVILLAGVALAVLRSKSQGGLNIRGLAGRERGGGN